LVFGEFNNPRLVAPFMESERLPVQTYSSGQIIVVAAPPGESDRVVTDDDAPGITGLGLMRVL
jgi:FixJ family two-component response regulator